MQGLIRLKGIKAVTGVYTGSAALIADAGHSLSDLFSDFVTLWAVLWTHSSNKHRLKLLGVLQMQHTHTVMANMKRSALSLCRACFSSQR